MPTADLDALLSQAKDYAAQSYARNTLIAYAADWKHFTAWCVEHGRRELPAAPETIICYLVALAETATVATLDRRLSSISFYHTQGRYALPTKDPEVLRTMRGIRRAKGVAPAVKTPILPALLGRMIAVLPDTLRGRRDRAVLLVGFAGAFRRGELVALTIADVEFVDAGLVVTLRRSKTDQEGAGRRVGIPTGQHAATCPVAALRAWLTHAAITKGPLFRVIDRYDRAGTHAMSTLSVARVVKHAVAAVGLDATQFSGHSLRAGLVTAAAVTGVEERIIMRQTGHTNSAMLRRYIREGELFRENAAAQVGL